MGTAWAATASYYYDELGRLIETVAADGTSVFYAYDAVGNITSVKHESVSAVGISGFSPATGPVGTTVTIFGSGFNTTGANNVVKFNGISATVTSATATTLIAAVPAGATTGTVSVTNGTATAISTLIFTVASSGAPTISNFSPTIGAQNTAVTIVGSNFSATGINDKTLFGTMAAPVSSATTSSIATSVPTAAASGKISVTTPFGSTTSAADFYAVPTGFNVSDVQYTGRIASFGATLTATTTSAGKTAIVLFDVDTSKTGTYLSLTNVTMSGGQVVVFSPVGAQLATASISNGASLKIGKLPMAGTYTIVMAPSVAGSATIQLGTVDLAISGFSVGIITSNPGHTWSIPVTYTVTNLGTLSTSVPWMDVAYLSSNGLLDDNSQDCYPLRNQSTPLAAGASYTVTVACTSNSVTAAGTYTLFVKADGHSPTFSGGTNTDAGSINEVSETNNIASATVKLDADLQISGLVLGTPVANTGHTWSIPVTYTVTNIGTSATASASWTDYAYLSSNGVLDASSQGANSPLTTRTTSLAAGASYTIQGVFTSNSATPAGTYTLFVKADGHSTITGNGTNIDTGNLTEVSETNNVASATVKLDADLQISGLVLGTPTANSNHSWSVPVTYTVTNIGTSATASANWSDYAYLSSNGVLDASSQASNGPLNTQTTSLVAGASYTVHSVFTSNTTTPAGTYTLFVKADGHSVPSGTGTNTDAGGLTEISETNNIASATVVLN